MTKKYRYDDKGKEIREVKGYVAINKGPQIKEQFTGEVVDIPVRFPKDLGTEHPFNFGDTEKTYKSVGIVAGAINKITDSIVGDFTIKSKNAKILTILNGFIKNTDFSTVLREWIREGFLKGNGFMELDLAKQKIRVLNANNMYVKRNRKGEVKEYNQWFGAVDGYKRTNLTKFNNFKPNQIAHLRVNKIAGEAYGLGIVWQNERVIENMIIGDEDAHKLIARKAGAPLHIKIGVPGEAARTNDIDEMNTNLQYMTNRTEWATDANVEMKVIDFGQVGKELRETLDHDMQALSYGMEIPLVLWGEGGIPEGLAKVQSEEKQRKIRAIQEDIESIIEEKIFKPILLAQKLDGDVEFMWNLPGEEEINKRLEKLTKLIENFNVSEPLRRMCELEVARLLNFEDAQKYLTKPEKEPKEPAKEEETKKAERKKEEDIKQPEVPGEKVAQNYNRNELEDEIQLEKVRVKSGEMSLREHINLKEVAGFNYSDFLVNILRRLRVEKFSQLAAITEADLAIGKLSQTEVNKLRAVFKTGFRKNQTIKQIEKEIGISILLKDVTKEGKVIVEAKRRPNMIARTETVRLANLGLIDTYKKNNIKQVRWLAAISDRTCSDCMQLDGQVFDINKSPLPPLHVNCRCSLLSVGI